jgi:hypothetical protein
MSSIPSLSSATTPLPSGHSHTHGHKRASGVESTDDLLTDNSTTAVPVGTQQNSFNSVLQSLQQAIAGQSATSTTAAATNAITSAAVSPTPGAATANTALQNYANNVSQQQRINGSPAARLPGSSVNINA